MFKLAFVLYELFWLAVFGFVLKRSLKNWGLAKTALFSFPRLFSGSFWSGPRKRFLNDTTTGKVFWSIF